MICIPIKGSNVDEMIRSMRLAEKKADITELWIDSLGIEDIKKIFKIKKKPVMIVNKGENEKGTFKGSEKQRMERIIKAIQLGADYFDIAVEKEKTWMKKIIKNKGQAKMILSYHNFESMPEKEKLDSLIKKMQNLKPDILKIAVTPKNQKEEASLIHIMKKLHKTKKKAIIIGMGKYGLKTRIQGLKYNAINFVALNMRKRSALGQLTIKQVQKHLLSSHGT